MVWVEDRPSVLKEWLNCLASYAPDSLVMIVKIHRFQSDIPNEDVENSINSVIENNDQTTLIGRIQVDKKKRKQEKKRKQKLAERCQEELENFLKNEFKPAKNLHFGKWSKELLDSKIKHKPHLNDHWFHYIDKFDAKGKFFVDFCLLWIRLHNLISPGSGSNSPYI